MKIEKYKQMMKKALSLLFFILFLTTSISATTWYFWRYRTHSNDCTSLTSAQDKDLCYQKDEQDLYVYDGGEWKPISPVGCIDASVYDNLDEAISNIGSTEKTLLISKDISVSADLTVPEDVTLKFTYPAKITIPNGVTLTINGRIDAGLWQIFDGDGTITGSLKTEAVCPEWFGAKGDGVTDDSEAVNMSLELGNVVLSEKTYLINDDLIIPKDARLAGKSLKTVLKYTGNGDCVKNDSDNNADGFIIENLTIQGTPSGQNGIYIKNTDKNCYIRNVYVTGFTQGNGFCLDATTGAGVYFVHFVNCSSKGNKIGAKIYTSDESALRANANSFHSCSFVDNSEDGIYVNYAAVDFVACEFEDNGSSGTGYDVNLGNCYVTIIGGHIENTARLLNVTSDTRGLIAFDSVTDGAGGTEVYFNGTKATKHSFRSMTNLKFILPNNAGSSWPANWLGKIDMYELCRKGTSDDKFKISHTGTISWGDGTNPPDCSLYRKSESQMRMNAGLSFTVKSIPDGDTSPSVNGSNVFKTNNSSTTSITTFDDGVAGQKITVIFGDSNTTIVHGSGIYLRDGADVTPSANTTMSFVYDGTSWYEE